MRGCGARLQPAKHIELDFCRRCCFTDLFGEGGDVIAGSLGYADFENSKRDSYVTVDLRAGIQGENWSVLGFAKNIGDEKYLEEVIPAPEFGGAFDHPGARRRYGVEVSYRF